MKKLNSKEIAVAIKNKMTIAQFAEKQGLAPLEVQAWMRKEYSERTFKKKMRQFQANEKVVVKTKSEEIVVGQLEEEVVPAKTRREDLMEKDQALGAEIDLLQQEHKSLFQKRNSYRNEARGISAQVDQLIEKVNSLTKSVMEIEKSMNETGEEMNRISERISEKETEREAVRQELEKLQNIGLFVYSNGIIGLSDENNAVTLDDAGQEDEQFSLWKSLKKEYPGLTLGQIEGLARLKCIVKNAAGMDFEILFEEPLVEQAWQSILTASNQ